MKERQIDETAIEMRWQEGGHKFVSTSFLIEDHNAYVVLVQQGNELSAYIEDMPKDDEDD